MRKPILLLCTAILSVGLISMIGCGGGTTGVPGDFAIAADSTGAKVVLTWTEPTEGLPDNYIIFFATGSSTTFDSVGATQELTFTHDPAGATGKYKVSARLSDADNETSELSTIPVATAATALSELNQTGNSGYGWSTTSSAGSTYSMQVASNATSVDFYLSNWNVDYTTLPYGIWAPDQGPTDPGGVVPTGAWKTTAIGTNLVADPQVILPQHVSGGTAYSQYCDMTSFPAYVAVYTTGGYYALIGVAAAPNAGVVQLQSWFQLVKGLRLIAH